jgi:hypothetical protein
MLQTRNTEKASGHELNFVFSSGKTKGVEQFMVIV